MSEVIVVPKSVWMLHLATTDEVGRHALDRIYLRLKEKKAMATDGRQIYEFPLETTEHESLSADYRVDYIHVMDKAAKEMSKSSYGWAITYADEKTARFAEMAKYGLSGKVMEVSNIYEGGCWDTMPPYEELFPKEKERLLRFDINPELLETLGKIWKGRKTGRDAAYVKVYVKDYVSPLDIYGENGEHALIMTAKPDNEDEAEEMRNRLYRYLHPEKEEEDSEK